MLNWGLSDLRIVNPQCDILSEQARALAVGSVELLENAKIYPSLRECVKDLKRVAATTARTRDMTQKMLTPAAAAIEAMDLCYKELDDFEAAGDSKAMDGDGEKPSTSIGIVFGRERGGLMNDELALCDSTIYIPAFEHYDVLNLAQAVNIIGYELWQRNLALRSKESRGSASATDSSLEPSTLPASAETAPKESNSGRSSNVEEMGKIRARSGDRLAKRAELDAFLQRLGDALFERGYEPISRNNFSKSPEWANLKPINQSTSISDSDSASALPKRGGGEGGQQLEGNSDKSNNGGEKEPLLSEEEKAWRELSIRSLQTIFQRVSMCIFAS
jgi:tRNA C32,U32 (ribose-2'-O)-methylase TrmJ